jgi:hypothetical protein
MEEHRWIAGVSGDAQELLRRQRAVGTIAVDHRDVVDLTEDARCVRAHRTGSADQDAHLRDG